MMRRWYLLAVLAGCVCACTRPSPPPEAAFYHWTTSFQPDSVALGYLHALDCRYLYVRAFDIDWDAELQMPVPLATLVGRPDSVLDSIALIPTVFITNRTFQAKELDTEKLAQRTVRRIGELFALDRLTEIQIDCDWSGSTRQHYFRYLDQLRDYLPPSCALSATVRLHQLRYPRQTGVPPVDRGMLMFYNMGEVSSPEEPNSILNLTTAQPYLEGATYPKPLDLALPLFRWGVLFREGQMIRLINGLDRSDLADTSRFTAVGGHQFRVHKSTYLQGYYLYRDDQIRLESVEAASLREAVAMLRPYPWPAGWRLSFYHLDSSLLQAYDYAQLQALVASF